MSRFLGILGLLGIASSQVAAVAGSLGTGKAATISIIAGIVAACTERVQGGLSKLNQPK